MSITEDIRELERERAKLDQLIDEALKNGKGTLQEETIYKQSRKVDALVAKVQNQSIEK